jgi:DNA-binding CsgD family transcriptional regulator
MTASRKIKNEFGLTQRQMEIVRRVADGYSNKEIARDFNISEATVLCHVNSAKRILRIKSRVLLAVWVVRNKLDEAPAAATQVTVIPKSPEHRSREMFETRLLELQKAGNSCLRIQSVMSLLALCDSIVSREVYKSPEQHSRELFEARLLELQKAGESCLRIQSLTSLLDLCDRITSREGS